MLLALAPFAVMLFSSVLCQDDPGEPLFLTPMIQAGEIGKAMEAAKVTEFYPNITSFSGLITVNDEYNSNVFFWYFPAVEAPENAPVILWSEGGPGISCFFSVLYQNGPFYEKGGNTTLNPSSWHTKYHMIYMDNPVDVGFSFTENEAGYVTSAEEAARDIHLFLTQFFQMFPNLQQNPFYNAGGSYGATYAINSAYYTHLQNQGAPSVRINLKGLIVDAPWIDPYSQTDYGNYLYHVGVISKAERDHFIEKENEVKKLIEEGNYLGAFQAQLQLTQRDIVTFAGYPAVANFYDEHYLDVVLNGTGFITSNAIRKAVHVGALNYSFVSPAQQSRMHPNFMRSARPSLETLLKAGYRFLMYTGNLDGTTGHIGVEKMIESLDWEGAPDLISSSRTIWKYRDRVAGYATSSGNNATYVLVRNSGHGCSSENPGGVLDIVMRFIEERGFSS